MTSNQFWNQYWYLFDIATVYNLKEIEILEKSNNLKEIYKTIKETKLVNQKVSEYFMKNFERIENEQGPGSH